MIPEEEFEKLFNEFKHKVRTDGKPKHDSFNHLRQGDCRWPTQNEKLQKRIHREIAAAKAEAEREM